MSSFAKLLPFVLASGLVGSADTLTPVNHASNEEPGGYSYAVSRVVRSFIYYTNWNSVEGGNGLQLCIVGPAKHSGMLNAETLGGKHQISVKNITLQNVATEKCNAIYIGNVPAQSLRTAMLSLKGLRRLTFAENDPTCRSYATVCLVFEGNSMNFRLNIEALTRSGLKLDPRVMRMGTGATLGDGISSKAGDGV